MNVNACHPKSLPPAFTEDEIYQALQNMKAGTAPGYDHVHPEFLKNLGPRAQTWLSRFFSRIIITNAIPKIWRKMKVIVIEKPGKDPRLAESYRPISLLSTCYKLLECLVLHRVSSEVEKLLSHDSRTSLVPEKSQHLRTGCSINRPHRK